MRQDYQRYIVVILNIHRKLGELVWGHAPDHREFFVVADSVTLHLAAILTEIYLRMYNRIAAIAVAGGTCLPSSLSKNKLHTRSRYSNRAVNYSNKAVTVFTRQCSLTMKL